MPTEFQPFQKIPRLSRECVITEKLDGTNASIYIGDDGEFLIGSRTRWITPDDDNYGFARWAHENKDELLKLGAGHHFGEWWGAGVQRRYGLAEKRFSLFNTHRWSDALGARPACCSVVPVLFQGIFIGNYIHDSLRGVPSCRQNPMGALWIKRIHGWITCKFSEQREFGASGSVPHGRCTGLPPQPKQSFLLPRNKKIGR